MRIYDYARGKRVPVASPSLDPEYADAAPGITQASDDFAATVHMMDIGQVQLIHSRVRSGNATLASVSGSHPGHSALLLDLRGGWCVTIDNSIVTLDEGEFLFYPAAVLGPAVVSAPAECFSVSTSSGALAAMSATRIQAIAMRTHARMLLSVAGLALDDAQIQAHPALDQVLESLLHLVAVTAETYSHDDEFSRAVRHIHARFRDATFTPDTLAREMNWSRATAYRIFANQGTSIGAEIAGARLRAALVLHEGEVAMTLSAIAEATGYSSVRRLRFALDSHARIGQSE